MFRIRRIWSAAPAIVLALALATAEAFPPVPPPPAPPAVPLVAERPGWLTPALEAQVLAAGGLPVAAPPDAPLPGAVGIRPGSWMVGPRGCTMSFVFAMGGSLAIGTAGHCVDAVGQHVVLLTVAPGTSNPVLVDLGPVIVRHEGGLGDDFALVSINPLLFPWVSATAAVIGGPCGEYLGAGNEVLMHYGHGLGIGAGGTPRAGLALTWSADWFGWAGTALVGDSGSPVRASGLEAAGVLTHAVLDWLPSAVAGTRISKVLQIAAGWTLVDSTLCP
jgi:hypothetical protein